MERHGKWKGGKAVKNFACLLHRTHLFCCRAARAHARRAPAAPRAPSCARASTWAFFVHRAPRAAPAFLLGRARIARASHFYLFRYARTCRAIFCAHARAHLPFAVHLVPSRARARSLVPRTALFSRARLHLLLPARARTRAPHYAPHVFAFCARARAAAPYIFCRSSFAHWIYPARAPTYRSGAALTAFASVPCSPLRPRRALLLLLVLMVRKPHRDTEAGAARVMIDLLSILPLLFYSHCALLCI